MMNQNVSTKLGATILVIIAITVGFFMWKIMGKQEVVEVPQNAVVQPRTVEKNQEQQNQEDQTKSGVPLDNVDISSFEKWKTYENNKIGITLKYPSEFYISTLNEKIIFDYLNPTDPLQNHEGSVLAHFSISLQQKTVAQYINDYKLNTLENFKKTQVELINTTAEKITYKSAFGDNFSTTLIKKGSDVIVINYSTGNGLKDTFDKMLSTINIL